MLCPLSNRRFVPTADFSTDLRFSQLRLLT
jgi:hypothetical protein